MSAQQRVPARGYSKDDAPQDRGEDSPGDRE
jgi:hypothetical protein